MIKDVKKWEAWERAYEASQPVDYRKNLAIVDALLELARKAGTFPPADPLEGIETKIRLARILNCSKNSFKPLPKP